MCLFGGGILNNVKESVVSNYKYEMHCSHLKPNSGGMYGGKNHLSLSLLV